MDRDRYDARLRRLPCVVCVLLDIIPPKECEELHHVGSAEERNEDAKVPLCNEHHQGPNGIHGLHRRGFINQTKLSDVTLLAMKNKLFRETL